MKNTVYISIFPGDGEKIIDKFREMGVDVPKGFFALSCFSNADRRIFYGVIGDRFGYYLSSKIPKGTTIRTLYDNQFPKMMQVWDHGEDNTVKENIIGITNDGDYISQDGVFWDCAREIPKTKKVKFEVTEEQEKEIKKMLGL